MAGFITSLQAQSTADGPRSGLHSGLRGVPLPVRDIALQEAIWSLASDADVDLAAVTAIWQIALRVEPWQKQPVWIHGDLHPGNLLVVDGRVEAVIDWGFMSVGDPAVDVSAAWSVLDRNDRQLFRELIEVDDATWARAMG